MMAMDNASKNAEELIEDLVLVMNKIRQAGITKELLEIMTAVEALKKG
jgi:F-type H+-transporting ATPase subunit gamma